jgi:hypothetical protein
VELAVEVGKFTGLILTDHSSAEVFDEHDVAVQLVDAGVENPFLESVENNVPTWQNLEGAGRWWQRVTGYDRRRFQRPRVSRWQISRCMAQRKRYFDDAGRAMGKGLFFLESHRKLALGRYSNLDLQH